MDSRGGRLRRMNVSPTFTVFLAVLAASAVRVEATFHRHHPRSFGKVTSHHRPYPSSLRTYYRTLSSYHKAPIVLSVEVCRKQPAGDPLGVCFKQATKTGGGYLVQCALGTRYNRHTCDCDISFADPREHYHSGYDCSHGAAKSASSVQSGVSIAHVQSVATAHVNAVAFAQARARAEARAAVALQALAKAKAQAQAQARATANAIAEIQAQVSVAHRQAEQAVAHVKAQSAASVSGSGDVKQTTTASSSPAPASATTSSTASASASATAGAGAGYGDDEDLVGSTAGRIRSSADMAQLLGAPEESSSAASASASASATATASAEASLLKELGLAASTVSDVEAQARATAELTQILLASSAGAPSAGKVSSSPASSPPSSTGSLLTEYNFNNAP